MTTDSIIEIAKKQRHLSLLEKVKGGRPLTKPELKELEGLDDNSNVPVGTDSDLKFMQGDRINGQAQAAEYARVSKRTIRRWKNDGMLVASAAGGVEVYFKTQLDLFKRQNDGDPTNMSEVRQRELTAQADDKVYRAKLRQLEYEIKTGVYILAGEVTASNVEKVVVLRRSFMVVGRKVAAGFPAKQRRKIRDAIDQEIETIIKGYAKGVTE